MTDEKMYRNLYLMYNEGYFVGVVELYGNLFPEGYTFYRIPYSVNYEEDENKVTLSRERDI